MVKTIWSSGSGWFNRRPGGQQKSSRQPPSWNSYCCWISIWQASRYLEPSPGNPHHRQFCHSLLVLTALGVGLKNLYEWQPEEVMDKCLRGLGLISGCAYVSHLLCDATTPHSLPLIGKL